MSSSPALVRQARLFATRKRARAIALPLVLQMQAAGIPTPETEVRFDRVEWWRFDYAWTPWMIALEVEGGVFTGGRHVRARASPTIARSTTAPPSWAGCAARDDRHGYDGRAITVLQQAFSARGLE